MQDNAWDKTKPPGAYFVNGDCIPFHFEGTICYFDSRTPVKYDLNTKRHIDLTGAQLFGVPSLSC